MYIDTHTHLFLKEFDMDRDETVKRAINAGVDTMILPNVDTATLPALQQMAADYPDHCFPLFGLHPGSVKGDYKNELAVIRKLIDTETCVGIGEIGLDFYWDEIFRNEQLDVFDIQLKWAAEKKLPVVIHLRNSHHEVIELVRSNLNLGLSGIFHCFTGTTEEANEIIELGFLLGIGGIVTFKNSGLAETLSNVDINHLVIETDSPYLAPVPYRGKRNESSYIHHVAEKLAQIYQLEPEKIAEITTKNAKNLFHF
ncbi:TatD family hydrolase [Bacteroidota bacterium]